MQKLDRNYPFSFDFVLDIIHVYIPGPISGMRCEQIIEPADRNHWNSNYLCVPQNYPYFFEWYHKKGRVSYYVFDPITLVGGGGSYFAEVGNRPIFMAEIGNIV